MQISALFIYPLKGGAAVQLSEAEMTLKGLKYDRTLMAVDPVTKVFVTQRANPRLATVKAVPDGDGVIL